MTNKKVLISIPEPVLTRMQENAKNEGYTLSGFVRELFNHWERQKEKQS